MNFLSLSPRRVQDVGPIWYPDSDDPNRLLISAEAREFYIQAQRSLPSSKSLALGFDLPSQGNKRATSRSSNAFFVKEIPLYSPEVRYPTPFPSSTHVRQQFTPPTSVPPSSPRAPSNEP